jgi:hypothetical protein
VSGSPGDAAIVNLTPVGAHAGGYGLLISSDIANPPPASNVNFGANTIDPNVAVAPIGADGKVCYVNSTHTAVDLIADHLGTIKSTAYTPALASGAPDRKVDTRIGLGVDPVVLLLAHNDGPYVRASQITFTCGTYFGGIAAGMNYYLIRMEITASGLDPDPTPDDTNSNGGHLAFEFVLTEDVPAEWRTIRGEGFADGAGIARLGPFPISRLYSARGTITFTHTPPDSHIQSGTSTFSIDVPCPFKTP